MLDLHALNISYILTVFYSNHLDVANILLAKAYCPAKGNDYVDGLKTECT